ncbi:MAG: ATP-binding protein [Polyangiaceae bacterium]
MPKYQGMTMVELQLALAAARDAGQRRDRVPSSDHDTAKLLEDLRVHEIELEMQNLALREAHAEVAESTARYADLYDSAPITYCAFDAQGALLEINLTGAAVLGRSREALLGLPFVASARVERPAAFFEHVGRCFAGEARVVSEVELTAAAGPVVMEMVSTPVRAADGRVIGCRTAMLDITERRRAVEVLRLFGDLALQIGGIKDSALAIDELARMLVPAVADLSVVLLFASGGQRAQVAAAHIDPAAEAGLRELEQVFPRLAGLEEIVAAVQTTGRPVLLPRARGPGAEEVSSGDGAALAALSVRSLLVVPLAARAQVVGVLALGASSSGRRSGAAARALAVEIARRAARVVGMAQLYGDALRATRARDEVMALVSHDLGGTAAAIAMAAESLLAGRKREERRGVGRGQVELIRRSAEFIQHMVRDLLDTTLIELGRLSVIRTPVLAAEVVAEAVEVVQQVATHAGVELAVDVPEDLLVLADRDRVRQVIVNLASNALKFSDRGAIVRLLVTSDEQRARFAVSDQGPGIAPADRERVFETFWHGEGTQSSGLGLAIAKRILDVHGERIWTETNPAGGATFLFTLPRAPTEQP